MQKQFKKMTLKERFDSRGFGVSSYARAYGVSHTILSLVLKGTYNGKHQNTKANGGATRKIIAQLKQDKIWIGKLPWEV